SVCSSQTLFNEDLKSSDVYRSNQVLEYDKYIKSLAVNREAINSILKPSYRSVGDYEKSVQPYRKAFAASIGYPPPGGSVQQPSQFDKIGEDSVGTYFRAHIPVLPGVECLGIYIVPKNLKGRAPLIISMHGGGGSPEIALYNGGSNYHDMVRGGAKRGYVVFAPTHLFFAEGFPRDIRNKTDERLRLVGTSITAVEIYKISKALDVLVKRPEVDSKRIAMVGLSYGGYYTLVTAALEPRIKVSVSSCYYGVQEGRYEQDELGVPSDFKFMGRMTLFNDQDLVALIAPRALEIQAGATDNASHREMGKRIAPQSAEYYNKLGLPDKFRFVVFNGGHEFHDETAWEWIKKHL
ncbi:MAG: dienelactone hydrolase family protein, partial [Chthonomonadales bacterium]